MRRLVYCVRKEGLGVHNNMHPSSCHVFCVTEIPLRCKCVLYIHKNGYLLQILNVGSHQCGKIGCCVIFKVLHQQLPLFNVFPVSIRDYQNDCACRHPGNSHFAPKQFQLNQRHVEYRRTISFVQKLKHVCSCCYCTCLIYQPGKVIHFLLDNSIW